MLLTNTNSDIISDKNQLSQIFFQGCKLDENIGVESEKLLVYKDSYKAVTYSDVVKILKSFSEIGWEKIFEGDNLIALKSDDGMISLEPGSQIELSLKPLKTLEEIDIKLTEFYNNLRDFADKTGAVILDSGIQCVSTFEDIDIIPKKRYEYMTKYLPSKNLSPFIMMRETAGIQVNFDYKSEEDAIKKLSLSLKMSPIISSIYANSPLRNSQLSEYKSLRADSWLKVDEQRCGFISKKLFDKDLNFSFSDYVETLLDVPLIFIQRGENYYYTDKTFREFLSEGFLDFSANMNDWQNHISLYFPDVRLKSYIEIRNHDAQNPIMTFSVPAFWKGIIYNPEAMEEIEKILSVYTYEDFMTLRKDTPLFGINAQIGKIKVIDLIKEFFDISYYSLKSLGSDEEKYLDCVYEYISQKRVPADNIIDNYNKKIS